MGKAPCRSVTAAAGGKPGIGTAGGRTPLSRRGLLTVAGVVGAAALARAIVEVAAGKASLMTTDSPSYIVWHTSRTPGYPAWLSAIGTIDPSFQIAPPVQAGVLGLAIVFLAVAFARLSAGRWVAIALGIALVSVDDFWKWSAQVRPEALFTPLTLLFFGALALTLATRSLAWLLAGSLAVGAAILMRPVGYAFVPALVFASFVFWRSGSVRRAIVMTAPCLALLVAASVANGLARGAYATQSFGGINLLAQAAPLIPEDGFGDPLSARIGKALQPLHQAAQAAEGHAYYWVIREGYNTAIWGTMVPMITETAEDFNEINSRAWQIARAAIAHDPLGYARIVLTHFHAMWTWRWMATAEQRAISEQAIDNPAFRTFIGANAQVSNIKTMPEIAQWLWVGLIGAAFLATCAVPLVVLFRRAPPPLLVLASIAALCVNAYDLLVAGLEPALKQYAMAILPALYTFIAALLSHSLARLMAKRRTTSLDASPPDYRKCENAEDVVAENPPKAISTQQEPVLKGT